MKISVQKAVAMLKASNVKWGSNLTLYDAKRLGPILTADGGKLYFQNGCWGTYNY